MTSGRTALASSTVEVAFDPKGVLAAIHRIREPLCAVRQGDRFGVANGVPSAAAGELLGTLPALHPEWLGDRSFCEAHRVRFPYVVGEMANAITTTRAVIAAGRAGFLGFFGAGGLTPARIEEAVREIARELGDEAGWGSNLIHSPYDPQVEEQTVEVYLRNGVRRVSASAFLGLTLPVVRYAASGLSRGPGGRVRRPNRLFAKISRPETARLFLSPAPKAMLDALVAQGRLTAEEAALAATVPLSEDVTVEADSGGHTDNRPLGVIFPAIARLRDELSARHGYTRPIRLGAAGGLGTPDAVAAAFALGASYVLTGSVNQVAVESGLGAGSKLLLSQAGVADVMMAPAADMFEMGVKVQILRRGTLFGPRAERLFDLYYRHDSLESLSPADRARLEAEIFQKPIAEIWAETERFWEARDPEKLASARRDPKFRMALLFRWYLGQASRWAIRDEPARKMDFQIWTGPAIGAFNDWVRGSFLEELGQRTIAQIGLNLLEGAAVVTRAQQLRAGGFPLGSAAFQFRPRPLA